MPEDKRLAYLDARAAYAETRKKLMDAAAKMKAVADQIMADWTRIEIKEKMVRAFLKGPGMGETPVFIHREDMMTLDQLAELLTLARWQWEAQDTAFHHLPNRDGVDRPLP